MPIQIDGNRIAPMGIIKSGVWSLFLRDSSSIESALGDLWVFWSVNKWKCGCSIICNKWWWCLEKISKGCFLSRQVYVDMELSGTKKILCYTWKRIIAHDWITSSENYFEFSLALNSARWSNKFGEPKFRMLLLKQHKPDTMPGGWMLDSSCCAAEEENFLLH